MEISKIFIQKQACSKPNRLVLSGCWGGEGRGRFVAVEIGVVAVVNPFFSDTVNDKTAGTQSTHIMAGFLLSHPLPRAMDEEAVVGNLESVVPCVLQCDAPCDPNPDRGLRTVDT